MQLVGTVATVIVLGVSGYNVITAFGSRTWVKLVVHILGFLGTCLIALEFFGLRVPLGADPDSGIQLIAFLMALILLTNYLLRRFVPDVLSRSE
ncbi:hypothetical protein [Halopelagius fulvigenes]|uniref:Uncharacterized protein n=1 Tax=Halopelagius fulvigenes TaxID=1198324 RepID=A0ABD5TWV9_9EURY